MAAFRRPGAQLRLAAQEFNQEGRHLESLRLRLPLVFLRQQTTDVGHEFTITSLEDEVFLKLGPADLLALVFQVS